jgi:hypothetical protein
MKKTENSKFNKKMIFSFCALTALVTISYAQPGGGQNGEPPKEAIEVCVGQEVGFECTMNTPRGRLTGTCMNTPDEKYFVCMPEGGPNKR